MSMLIFMLLMLSIVYAKNASISDQSNVDHLTKNINDENYNESQAFAAWLNRTLENYDSRVRPYFGALIGISSISETDMSFSAEMYFHESWNDDRLRFERGAFGTRHPITLPLDAPMRIWTPDTSFLNALKSEIPKIGSVSHLFSMMLYPNGTVGYSRRISVTAQCLMNLTMYPFDKQACKLELSSYGWTHEDIVYEWMRDKISTDGLSLADFVVKDSKLKVINKTYAAGVFSCPTLCVLLVRRSGFCFLQLFIPATAVVISSWISLWLDNETQFTDLVSVILAIIFLSYSYNTVMPKVSYVKAMDIYLLACFIFVFFSLVKLAIVKYMRMVVHKRKEKHAVAQASAPPPIPVGADSITDEPLTSVSASEPIHVFIPTEDVEMIQGNSLSSAPNAMEITIDHRSDPDFLVNPSTYAKAHRTFSMRRPKFHNWHRSQQTQKSAADRQKRRRTGARIAMQQAISQRMLQWRLMALGTPLFHLPSLHDNYWKCMKAFHLGSQLILPLAFGAFALFFFFIYPSLRIDEGTCD